MSHFNACVLIKRDGLSLDQMGQRASDMLANFDINKEMPPYKYYVKADEIQSMAKSYKIDSTNFSALAEKLEDWNGDKGGVDENGLYGISTNNPDGHIDYWEVFTEVKPEDWERLLFGRDGEERVARVVVTPAGEWIDGPYVYAHSSIVEDKEIKEWSDKIATLLDEHRDAAAFLAECHI
jgi:hypothetical protein